MAIIGGTVGFQLLQWYAPIPDESRMDGSAYQHRSKLRTLLGDALLAKIVGKTVLDFGCGEGAEAIEMAKSGARRVFGVDIQPALLERARERAAAASVQHIVEFATDAPQTPVDLIVSLDSFEHFADPAHILRVMANILPSNGQVVVSFGPTWFHPLGGHFFSVFPWAHLIFSERSLIRWRSQFKKDGAQTFAEVAGGLNRMTIARFERLVSESPFELSELECVPIRSLQRLSRPWNREFTTAIVRCVLTRRTA